MSLESQNALSTPLTAEQIARFWGKVRVDPAGCWVWTAGKFAKTGYGAFKLGPTNVGAHRVAFALAHGGVPAGMQVCHTCDNRACVRQDHLFLGSNSDNIADKVAKGRQSKGAAHGRAVQYSGRHAANVRRGPTHPCYKFSDAVIARALELRSQGWLQSWIARELGMTRSYVSLITRGKKRAHHG